MAYSDKVVDHYENPRNVGSFDKGDDSVGTGMVGAPACGDVMKLQLKIGANGIIEDAKFKQLRFIEWVKTNPVPINSKINYLTNSREIALTAIKGSKPTFHSKYDKGIYEFGICHERDRFHPTQKPLNLLKALITKHSNEGDLVLDCFAGSASCAVACNDTSRSFIGCELDETYYTKATERIQKLNDKSTDVSSSSQPEQ